MRDDGRLGERRVFSDEKLPGYCDGSAIDADGYLWNARFAGACLIRFAPDGRVDRRLELPVTNPTCCCFGGPDLRTLYVTSARFGLCPEQLARNPAEGALLAVDVGVAGHAVGAVRGLNHGADRVARSLATSPIRDRSQRWAGSWR